MSYSPEQYEAMASKCEGVFEGDHPGDMAEAAKMLRSAATLRQQAARVDEVKLPDPETMCAMWIKPDTSADEYAAFLQGARKMRAALEAALSAQPAERQGEGWPVRANDLVEAFSAEIYDVFADADGEVRQGAVVDALERAIGKKCKFPIGDNGDYNLEGALLSIEQRQDAMSRAVSAISSKPDAWRHRYFDKATGVGFWRYGVGEPEPSNQTGNLGFEKQPLYTHPAAPVGVPDGMVLVPAIMTAEMVNAWTGGVSVTSNEIAARGPFQDAWSRVLTAAPSAPQGVE